MLSDKNLVYNAYSVVFRNLKTLECNFPKQFLNMDLGSGKENFEKITIPIESNEHKEGIL